ncbi:MAG: ABC transporter permease [Burkholderiaceae bacterium]
MFREFKFWLSDAICGLLEPVAPALFAKSCSRFADGFIVTIELLILSCVIGFCIALTAVLCRLSSKPLLKTGAFLYIYLFRGTPLLVQFWIVYFGIGSLGEASLGPLLWPLFKDAWWVGLIVLSLNTGAYVAEILRGGLVNVPAGQMEAAVAHGMSWLQAMRRIMLPQALRIAWPAYGNELVLLMKGSALVSTITVMDLMGQTRTIFSRSYDLSVYLYAALLYLLIAGVITLFCRLVENRLMNKPASA